MKTKKDIKKDVVKYINDSERMVKLNIDSIDFDQADLEDLISILNKYDELMIFTAEIRFKQS